MSNQLPIYLTQACLRPWGGIQSRILLRRSQAKAILRQRHCGVVFLFPLHIAFNVHILKEKKGGERENKGIGKMLHCKRRMKHTLNKGTHK
jgi:hypothetical protein